VFEKQKNNLKLIAKKLHVPALRLCAFASNYFTQRHRGAKFL